MDPQIAFDNVDNQQQQHHCKLGFSCIGALGGCIRTHDHAVEPQSVPGFQPSYFLCAKGRPRYHVLGASCDFDGSNEDQDLANCLVMLSNRSYTKEVLENKVVEKSNIFQCKACKKVFNSHQALGGHRASHKKVKGCYAAKLSSSDIIGDVNDKNNELIMHEDHRKRAKATHECSVCLRVFSSGQSLGGHKRYHWLTTSMETSSSFIPNHHNLDLNLNLPTLPGVQSQGDIYSSSGATRLYFDQFPIDHKPENTRKLGDLKQEATIDGEWLQMGCSSTPNG